jgi:hypothetical protein
MSTKCWKGCFISEGLTDPTILNGFKCYKFYITGSNLEIDENGNLGRWHMYWIEATENRFDIFVENMKYGWYGHFWRDNEIVVIFNGKKFILDKNNKETWKEAINYGLSQNIKEEQLDFKTD